MLDSLPQTIFRGYQSSEGLRSDRTAGDRARHREKVKSSIKDNLADIVADESLIGKQGDRIIKVPIKSIKEYRFVYGDNPQVGTGEGESQPGDKVGQGQDGKPGKGKDGQGGDQAGVDYYETEITLDELKALLFEELKLPNLKKVSKKDIIDKSRAKKDGYRRMGINVRLDRFKTAKMRVKRKKATLRHGEIEETCEVCEGTGWVNPNPLSPDISVACEECEASGMVEKRFRFRKEDRRFKHMEVKPKPSSNAAIILIMDVSGSMDTAKKFLARSFFYFLHEFIKEKYDKSELVFISHHTEAQEVTQEEFFHKGESGGTFVSSGLLKAQEVIDERYNPSVWNNYVMYISDGDNFDTDNPKAIDAMTGLCKVSRLVGYGEIKPKGSRYYESSLLGLWDKIEDKDKVFRKTLIEGKEDVWPALKKMLSIEE